jgi:DNA-directed RNA polymerase specialized sigma24 family protein
MADQPTPESKSTFNVILGRELREVVRAIILDLPPIERFVLTLSAQGLSEREIAAELSSIDDYQVVEVRSVKRALQRAREKVAKALPTDYAAVLRRLLGNI